MWATTALKQSLWRGKDRTVHLPPKARRQKLGRGKKQVYNESLTECIHKVFFFFANDRHTCFLLTFLCDRNRETAKPIPPNKRHLFLLLQISNMSCKRVMQQLSHHGAISPASRDKPHMNGVAAIQCISICGPWNLNSVSFSCFIFLFQSFKNGNLCWVPSHNCPVSPLFRSMSQQFSLILSL